MKSGQNYILLVRSTFCTSCRLLKESLQIPNFRNEKKRNASPFYQFFEHTPSIKVHAPHIIDKRAHKSQ